MRIPNRLIRETERAHYLMQLSSYFSELIDRPGVRFAYTFRFTDIWYNQAYDIEWDPNQMDELLLVIEKFLSSKDRLPCIYVTPAVKPEDIGGLLEERGYGKFETEAWMFYDFEWNKKPAMDAEGISITEVKSDKELEIFSEVYRKGLPGPEVELYIDSVVDGMRFKPPMVDMWYFIANFNGEPAGMASLLKIGEFAGLYAVATIEQFQNKGICRSLCRFIGEFAAQNNANHLFLQTVVGEESEIVFRKVGYKTLYVRDGFTTKEEIENLKHG